MKKTDLPEYLLSTPRLILVIMTIALVIFTYTGIGEYTVFKDALLVVLGYFFGSRGKEETKKQDDQPVDEVEAQQPTPEEDFISDKFNNDGSNQ